MTEPGPHLVLVGLPGSGKTTAGALAAGHLTIPFHDADDLIEEQEGMTVAGLFAERGEAAFRSLERLVVERLLQATPRSIIAPGGGWAAQPGNLDTVRSRGLVVHLVVSPETAAARLGRDGSRPLLAGDALTRLRELAAARRAFYQRADAAIPTEGRSPEEVARELAELARSAGRE